MTSHRANGFTDFCIGHWLMEPTRSRIGQNIAMEQIGLSSGARLGHYQIQSLLGVGAMGEVYRARDTRLDRTVAIKILRSHLGGNTAAKRRFEREARAVSSLNHPNICTLHDVGAEHGASYLVLEYLQGETLETRLKPGALPLKQVLECGAQISDALEKVHRAGIIHRDLKPGNIMLTPTGAKLFDFGLAKPTMALVRAPVVSGPLSPSPTMNLSALPSAGTLTQEGSLVGTFQFMAPEVLQGREADARSDIFSFGCVLYEMVTGRPAFEGKSQSSVASAILEKDPEPLSKTQPMAPASLDHVVQQCLVKDPELRWQSAADITRELQWIGSSAPSGTFTPTIPARRPTSERLLWGAAIALLLAKSGWSALRGTRGLRRLRSF